MRRLREKFKKKNKESIHSLRSKNVFKLNKLLEGPSEHDSGGNRSLQFFDNRAR